MISTPEYKLIYRAMLSSLDEGPKNRNTLILSVLNSLSLTPEEIADNSAGGRKSTLRSVIGSAINAMRERGLIICDRNGYYHANAEKPVVIRIERCEEEIIKLLRERISMSKVEIKDALIKIFRTDKTSSVKDDNKLSTYMGQVLKSLLYERVIEYDGSIYSIKKARSAEIKNRQEVAALKADFLTIIHSKGGEFFEYYFMNLLSRYLVRSGKTVTECRVIGGAADGGIDGIAKTVDALGFKEVIMVQTKNRLDEIVETDVRGFYGAVCAAQGSRGIFATTSDFHTMAKSFLDSIDDCVGVNGDRIFSMAQETSYGIKREGDRLIIDREVIY